MGIDNVVRKGKVDIIDTMTFLVIPDSTRDDSGKYCLILQSPAGEKAVFVNVKVLGMLHVRSNKVRLSFSQQSALNQDLFPQQTLLDLSSIWRQLTLNRHLLCCPGVHQKMMVVARSLIISLRSVKLTARLGQLLKLKLKRIKFPSKSAV